MLILFDQATPFPLHRFLPGHDQLIDIPSKSG
jgi:hypothetical protein